MEEFEEFMAEMLEEYNYDKDTVMVTTAFAQALASEWEKKLLIQRVSNQRELLITTFKEFDLGYIQGFQDEEWLADKVIEVINCC